MTYYRYEVEGVVVDLSKTSTKELLEMLPFFEEQIKEDIKRNGKRTIDVPYGMKTIINVELTMRERDPNFVEPQPFAPEPAKELTPEEARLRKVSDTTHAQRQSLAVHLKKQGVVIG
jgi:hypothetical protein